MPGLKNIIETLKKGRGKPILTEVDKVLIERNETTTEIEGWLHPSAMVPWKKGWDHVCPRELFYTRFAAIQNWPEGLLQSDFSPRTFRIFDNGQWVHRRWQIYLIQAGMTNPQKGVGWEIPVRDADLGVLGHVDAVVYPQAARANDITIEYYDHGIPRFNPDGGLFHRINSNKGQWIPVGEPVIVDVKSTKDYYWNNLSNKPLIEHQVQMTCYMALLKIYVTHLIYENKNTQEVKEIIFRFDPKRWSDFRKILLNVDRARKERKIPPRICDSAVGARAQECPWVEPCFSTIGFNRLVQIENNEHGKKKNSTQGAAG